MYSYLLTFSDIDATKSATVGGKAANLGELWRIDGIHVPDGFCIGTDAFLRIIASSSSLNELLHRLSVLQVEDRAQIGDLSQEIRRLIEEIPIPHDIIDAITRHLARLGEHDAYAIRSSATAEDLPTASFAGQQDTYLNIAGKHAILQHISKCWASLFTERAIAYRIHEGFDHRNARLAVVVQVMIPARAAGVLFTADPITSNRKLVSIDAGFGLGEALVSGLVNPDNYTVRSGRIIDKRIAAKSQVLTDEQILQLERIGRRIEKHFGHPQDIEWCLAGDVIYIVQSRPVTTLYPIPEANDQRKHVFISVGHQQMMTDPFRPLGISFWQLTAGRPMYTAGGRMFVDVADNLATRAGSEALLNAFAKSDPLITDALRTLIDRSDFDSPQDPIPARPPAGSAPLQPIEPDPAIVAELIRDSEASIEELKANIRMASGTELFDFILEDIARLKKSLYNQKSLGLIMTAMNASSWINDNMLKWLGEKNVADTLSQSVPDNITSEMGLALLDVADVIRPYPTVIEYLQQLKDDRFLAELITLNGGLKVRSAIDAFLNRYGMRCVGEIDITKTRWSEDPAALVPLILSNIKNCAAGAASRKFEQGRQDALKKERDLLDRLASLPEGGQKVGETRRMISLIRTFIGYREYPKYAMISRYFEYKRALLKEAGQLVQAGVLRRETDVYYLGFEEFREAVRASSIDIALIDKRKAAYNRYLKLTPPRVLTSDGEIIAGAYRRQDIPPAAMIGLAVSSGVVEGRARVILRMEDADLGAEDILVTPFTDPSWTALFVSIKGHVTEVGGLMTHGAVIAREYGIPAVVGVQNATRLIKDGQRIQVNGTEGYVEILQPAN